MTEEPSAEAQADLLVDEALALTIEIGKAAETGKLGVTWPVAHAALLAAYRRGIEDAAQLCEQAYDNAWSNLGSLVPAIRALAPPQES